MPSIITNVRMFARMLREKYFTSSAERAMREQMEKEIMVQSIVAMVQKQKAEREETNTILGALMKQALNVSEELEKIKKSPQFLEKYFEKEYEERLHSIKVNPNPNLVKKEMKELEEWKQSVKEFSRDWGRLTPEQMIEKMRDKSDSKQVELMEDMKRFREKQEMLAKEREREKERFNREIEAMRQRGEHGGLSPEMRRLLQRQTVQMVQQQEDMVEKEEKSERNNDSDSKHGNDLGFAQRRTSSPPPGADAGQSTTVKQMDPSTADASPKDDARIRELMDKLGIKGDDLGKVRERLLTMQDRLRQEKEQLIHKAQQPESKQE